jgi:hypothetical protein
MLKPTKKNQRLSKQLLLSSSLMCILFMNLSSQASAAADLSFTTLPDTSPAQGPGYPFPTPLYYSGIETPFFNMSDYDAYRATVFFNFNDNQNPQDPFLSYSQQDHINAFPLMSLYLSPRLLSDLGPDVPMNRNQLCNGDYTDIANSQHLLYEIYQGNNPRELYAYDSTSSDLTSYKVFNEQNQTCELTQTKTYGFGTKLDYSFPFNLSPKFDYPTIELDRTNVSTAYNSLGQKIKPNRDYCVIAVLDPQKKIELPGYDSNNYLSLNIKLFYEEVRTGWVHFNEKTINWTPATGIESLDSTKISFYPNPTSDVLNIRLQDEQANIKNISILDVSGRKVKEVTTDPSAQTLSIDVRDLTKGTYLIQINDGHHSKAMSFIKN